MAAELFETVFDLTSVRGAFDAAGCFDVVAPATALGAWAGATRGGGVQGALAWGLASGGTAALTSTACGDGQRSPMTMLREGVGNFMSNGGSSGAWSGGTSDPGGSIPTGVP